MLFICRHCNCLQLALCWDTHYPLCNAIYVPSHFSLFFISWWLDSTLSQLQCTAKAALDCPDRSKKCHDKLLFLSELFQTSLWGKWSAHGSCAGIPLPGKQWHELWTRTHIHLLCFCALQAFLERRMKFPCYSWINWFLSLDRLLWFHVHVFSLTESGQAPCYTGGLVLGLVLVTNNTKTYIHKLCVPLKSRYSSNLFFFFFFFQNESLFWILMCLKGSISIAFSPKTIYSQHNKANSACKSIIPRVKCS